MSTTNKIIPGNSKPFSIKPTVVWVKISEKTKNQFFRFEISLQQASKYKKTYFVIGKILQTLEGHDHYH